MTMLKADSDGTEVLGNRFCYDINFAEGCASSRQGTSDFVDKNRASKTTGCRKKSTLGRHIMWRDCGYSPPSNYAPLSPADGNIVTNDKKLDFICLVWVLSSELFFCQTKVEDISGVIPKPAIS